MVTARTPRASHADTGVVDQARDPRMAEFLANYRDGLPNGSAVGHVELDNLEIRRRLAPKSLGGHLLPNAGEHAEAAVGQK